MGGPEGVVYVFVAVSRERSGELGRVPRFARVEAEVFEKQDVAGPEFRRPAALASNHLGLKADRLAEELLEPLGDRPQAERRVGLPAGPAQMRGNHHRGALLAGGADSGKSGVEATVIRHASVFERCVQIGPQQEATAAQVEVGKRQFPGVRGHGGANLTFRRLESRWYVPRPHKRLQVFGRAVPRLAGRRGNRVPFPDGPRHCDRNARPGRSRFGGAATTPGTRRGEGGKGGRPCRKARSVRFVSQETCREPEPGKSSSLGRDWFLETHPPPLRLTSLGRALAGGVFRYRSRPPRSASRAPRRAGSCIFSLASIGLGNPWPSPPR